MAWTDLKLQVRADTSHPDSVWLRREGGRARAAVGRGRGPRGKRKRAPRVRAPRSADRACDDEF